MSLKVRGDSYVLESKIHFPTDLNLLADSGRKVVSFLTKLGYKYKGHRQLKSEAKKWKNAYFVTSEIHRKKGHNYETRLKSQVHLYLKRAKALLEKACQTISIVLVEISRSEEKNNDKQQLINKLQPFVDHLVKHMDLVERRILKGEKIPHEEKLFSIFEEHVEWISKGKAGKSVEFGHRHLVYSDQYQFILHQTVLVGQTDKEVALSQGKKIPELYGDTNYNYDSISYDRGFYSFLAKTGLEKEYGKVIMPKAGKKTADQTEEESSPEFVSLRHHHSGIEANINSLEHTGLDKCPDKGLDRFKNYAALGVLAHNIGNLGKWIAKLEAIPIKKAA